MSLIALVWALPLAVGASPSCELDWLPTGGLPGVNSDIVASTVWDPDGSGPLSEVLVVGGGFSIAGDLHVNGIAAWDGNEWHTIGGITDISAHALGTYQGDLVAAAGAVFVGNTWHKQVRRWDGKNWQPLGLGFSNGTGNTPYLKALIEFNGDLIATGSFESADGAVVNNVARWDGMKWQAMSSGLTRTSSSGNGNALAVLQGELIVGGRFDFAGGVPVRGIARWDGRTWSALGGGVIGTATYPEVNALVVHGDQLIAGGKFYGGGSDAPGVASWDGQEWYQIGTSGARWVECLAIYDDSIIAAGFFGPGQIVRWNGDDWVELEGGISLNSDPRGGGCEPILIDTSVRSLAVFQNELIATGSFTLAGGKSARRIARWDGSDWNPIGTGMSVAPRAFTIHEGMLIAGGGFQEDGEFTVSKISAFDGRDWHHLGDGVHGAVQALASYQGNIVVGGQFSLVSDPNVILAAQWDGTEWRSLGTGIGNRYECDHVAAFEEYNGDLIVLGNFDRAGDTDAKNIARWDGGDWHTFGEEIAGGISAMTTFEGRLIVGGSFLKAGGVPARNIAAWDGSNWSSLGNGIDDWVVATTVYDGDVIVFYVAPNEFPLTYVTRWNGTSWTPMGRGPEYYVSALTTFNGHLYASGNFMVAGDVVANGIARWDGEVWQALPRGIQFFSWDMIVYQGDLIASGSAFLTNGKASPNWSRWGSPNARGDFDADHDVDLLDASTFANCLSGPARPTDAAIATQDCLCAFNVEGDADIDLADAAVFQNAFFQSPRE